jgi:hypothetical protein
VLRKRTARVRLWAVGRRPWASMQPARFERRALGAGRPLYAVLFPLEINQLHAFDRMPGGWTQIGRIRHVTMGKLEAS